MNYAYNVDVYQIWAESLMFDKNRSFPEYHFQSYVTHFAQSDKENYEHSRDEVFGRYGDRILLENAPPSSISGGMGSHVYLIRADSTDEIWEQAEFILSHKA